MRASEGSPGPCVARGAEDLGDTPQGKRGCVPLTSEGVTWRLLSSTNLASSCRRACTSTLGDPAAVLAWITRPSDLGKKRCTCGLPGRRRRSDNHFPVGCPPSRGTSNSADQGADALVPAILREVTLAPERGKADTLADVPDTTF